MNQENNPITPDALTTILYKRADKKLEGQIDTLLRPLYRPGGFVTLGPVALRLLTPARDGRISIQNLVNGLKDCLIGYDTEGARAAEVTDFLAKVENTAAELDAIREEINQ